MDAFDALVGAQRVGIVNGAARHGDGRAGADQALLVINTAATRVQADIAQHLNLPALVLQAAQGQVQRRLADDLAATVIQLAHAARDVASGAQVAARIVPAARLQVEAGAAADAAGTARMAHRIRARIRVEQSIAVRIDGHGAARLQQAAIVVQDTRLQVDGSRARQGALRVVEDLAMRVERDVRAGNGALPVPQAAIAQDDVATRLQGAATVDGGTRSDHLQLALHRGQLAASAVVDAGRVHGHTARGGQQAARIVQCLHHICRQLSACRGAAALVQQSSCTQHDIAAAGDGAAMAVIKHVVCRQRQVGRAGRLQLAALVVQGRCDDIGVAVAGDGAATVVQAGRQLNAGIALAQLRQVAAGIVQGRARHAHLLRDGTGVAVVNGAGRDDQGAIARDLSAQVVQLRGLQAQGAAARMFDLAIRIRQGTRLQAQVGAVDGDAPARVVQHACWRCQLDDGVARARLYDAALLVIEVAHANGQLAGADIAALVVPGLAIRTGRDRQGARRGDHGTAGADVSCCRRQIDIAGTAAAAAKVDATAAQNGIACRQHLAMGTQRLLRRDL
ncbi:hypothetical protein D3C87_966430 [compost metagenome]